MDKHAIAYAERRRAKMSGAAAPAEAPAEAPANE
jgi:hypothetical protein